MRLQVGGVVKSESEIQQLIQIEAAKHHCILMRNNSGAMQGKDGRLVRFGLGNDSPVRAKTFKSSDLIGIHTIVVTPEMVGQLIGVFVAVEVKAEGWHPSVVSSHEQAQRNFTNWVKARGGKADLCNSVDSFLQILTR